MATPSNGNGNLVDEFEEAFQSCLNVLTKQEATPTSDKEEIRTEVDTLIQRFIDLGRQMEAFFLQKRFLLSALKPDLVYKEDNNELKLELTRKDEVIKRHHDKIIVWQKLLDDLQGWAKSPAQGSASTPTMSNGSSLTPGGGSAISSPISQSAAPMPGVPGMQSPLQTQMQQAQQMQHLQQQQQQHMLQQQQQMQQMQQQHMQQMQVGAGGPMGVSPQQAMFMQQQNSRGAFSQGPGNVLQGPLAYLEKTTSNIDLVGMGDGRR
ncbi:mediator of RNA polymerase II transcription subunit 28-like isoform X2 [Ctenocephalides felis]|uniref:mediator of RNA polymerase II transcription subunit 28-like isoform X2 n=1 Tax=Ctenocephalides felis TaxID=7515 RepID=UPI000E6E5996|nr:mediator of RNA polymerase II transcription subunit 28-like isoform X2 [Ctenocephalides felis]